MQGKLKSRMSCRKWLAKHLTFVIVLYNIIMSPAGSCRQSVRSVSRAASSSRLPSSGRQSDVRAVRDYFTKAGPAPGSQSEPPARTPGLWFGSAVPVPRLSNGSFVRLVPEHAPNRVGIDEQGSWVACLAGLSHSHGRLSALRLSRFPYSGRQQPDMRGIFGVYSLHQPARPLPMLLDRFERRYRLALTPRR